MEWLKPSYHQTPKGKAEKETKNTSTNIESLGYSGQNKSVVNVQSVSHSIHLTQGGPPSLTWGN